MHLLIRNTDLHTQIWNKDLELNAFMYARARAAGEDFGLQSATKETIQDPNIDEDPTPYWLTDNNPEDWHRIALEHSRTTESVKSGLVSPSLVSGSSIDDVAHRNRFSVLFRPESPVFKDRDHNSDEELESAYDKSDIAQNGTEEQPVSGEVENLKAENEMLRLKLQAQEDKDKANEERERKRAKLHADFLKWAPKIQHEGWLTNKVRKAYAACQKIVEALESED